MTEEQRTWLNRIGRSSGILMINIAVMVVIVCVLSFWVTPSLLDNITDHDARISVDDVVGIDAEEAMSALEAQGLKPIVIDTIFSDMDKPGIVLDQLPEGNLPVKPGRNVYLTINSYTTQNFVFPDVIEHSSRQACSILDEQFFVVDSVIYEPYRFDDLVLKVYKSGGKQEMVPGKEYPKRTHVVLLVSSTNVKVEAVTEETEDSFFD